MHSSGEPRWRHAGYLVSLGRMLSFDTATHRFHVRAAAIARRGNEVLLHRLESEPFWALPGGRVEPGESAAETIVREFREELGEDVTCGSLIWMVENFFPFGNRQFHEVGFYFAVDLPAGSPMATSRGAIRGIEPDVPLTFSWFDASRLGDIDLRPSFLVKSLAVPVYSFQHIVHRSGNAA